MVSKSLLTNIERRGTVVQKNGNPKCMVSQAENWGKNRVDKDLQGYCHGQITLRFFLEFACSGESHRLE